MRLLGNKSTGQTSTWHTMKIAEYKQNKVHIQLIDRMHFLAILQSLRIKLNSSMKSHLLRMRFCYD